MGTIFCYVGPTFFHPKTSTSSIQQSYGSLEELYDLGNILELFKRQSGMVSFGFLDELKYWNIKKNDDKVRFVS
jgi:hypothetical protein